MEAWIPFLQTLVWPVFLAVLLLATRGWVREVLDVIKVRIREGSEMSVGPSGLTIGAAPRLEPPADRPATRSAAAVTADDLHLAHAAEMAPAKKGLTETYYRVRVQLLTDDEQILEKVSRVVYHLHPTFPEPERVVTTADNNFALEFTAWGQFTLTADVFVTGQDEPIQLSRFINF